MIILMRNLIANIGKFFQQSFYNNLEPKNITNPCLPRVASRRLVYRSLRDFMLIYHIGRICGGRERDSEKQPTVVASLK